VSKGTQVKWGFRLSMAKHLLVCAGQVLNGWLRNSCLHAVFPQMKDMQHGGKHCSQLGLL
jgi:hypothetical protein